MTILGKPLIDLGARIVEKSIIFSKPVRCKNKNAKTSNHKHRDLIT